METGDSRQASFDSARVRDALKFAMRMGLPGTQSERVTFFWDSEPTYTNPDVNSNPWDWTTAPTSTVSAPAVPSSLSVPVAVEFLGQSGGIGTFNNVGDFNTPRVKVTVLDEEYTSLTDLNLGLPTGLTVDGSTYIIEYWVPPIGLFDLTVYECFAVARDEA